MEFIKILKRRILLVIPWPERKRGSYIHDSGKDQYEYDSVIAEYAAKSAYIFIDKYENSKDPMIRDKVSCLKYLLFHYHYINPFRYVVQPVN